MDERDAKAQGLELHRREMTFVRGYVSCMGCGCNYDATTGAPTFCQKYSKPIEPTARDENILRAQACEQWVHERLDRNMVVHPDHTYRYETWGTPE